MSEYKVTVYVFPRRASRAPDTALNRMMGTVGKMQGEILDPQGIAVQKALLGLGFVNVSKVRIGKHYELLITARSKKAVREKVKRICKQYLCDLTEDHKITSVCKIG